MVVVPLGSAYLSPYRPSPCAEAPLQKCSGVLGGGYPEPSDLLPPDYLNVVQQPT